ncbi:phospholipase D-like domain-containing protein [Variovorax sp. M-6]|uniref:phospholipase D-like domain-containing protein n=1 Tax=Variovorax sp. M-6 TaxID=3233041 RepID=UPI003F97B723
MNKVDLRVYSNIDDAFLVWRADELEGCLGFAIERIWLETRIPGRALNTSEFLLNRVGFAADTAAGPNQRNPSNVWPFQRYNWTDHDLSFGDRARYRVVPMVGAPSALGARADWASEWLEVDATQPASGRLSCFFNRPMAASPWMARIASEKGIETSSALVATVTDTASEFLRDFCGGTLIFALRNMFDFADSNPAIHLYAALFELEDPEVVDRFCRLGPRAHVVLSNGSAKPSEPDASAEARKAIHAAGCEVVDRMTSNPNAGGDLGHNKFIVVAEGANPIRVWTGSTNLTPTGLFTQVNNAILVDSEALADQYLDQWKRLARAKSEAPSTLKKDNAAPDKGTSDPATIQPWFTPTVKHNDLARMRELIAGAKEGILFLSFMPGATGPVVDILEERANGMYVRGVVNQFVGGPQGKLVATLTGGSKTDPMDLDAFTPTGIKEQFAFWAKEFMRGGKISVLVHSKVMCIDPFGDHPVVITGSHNFSSPASESNDENFIIVENDKAVAQAYAAHIISVYNHYRWRQYVGLALADGDTPWQALDDKATWQGSRVRSLRQKAEWTFWM